MTANYEPHVPGAIAPMLVGYPNYTGVFGSRGKSNKGRVNIAQVLFHTLRREIAMDVKVYLCKH